MCATTVCLSEWVQANWLLVSTSSWFRVFYTYLSEWVFLYVESASIGGNSHSGSLYICKFVCCCSCFVCFFAVFISCITKIRPGYWFRLVSGFVCATTACLWTKQSEAGDAY